MVGIDLLMVLPDLTPDPGIRLEGIAVARLVLHAIEEQGLVDAMDDILLVEESQPEIPVLETLHHPGVIAWRLVEVLPAIERRTNQDIAADDAVIIILGKIVIRVLGTKETRVGTNDLHFRMLLDVGHRLLQIGIGNLVVGIERQDIFALTLTC